MPPQIVRGHRLHGGEYDIVDAGQQHEEDPVGQPQGVPVGDASESGLRGSVILVIWRISGTTSHWQKSQVH